MRPICVRKWPRIISASGPQQGGLTLAEHILEGRSQILSNMLKATYELWGSVSRGYNCKVTREDEPDTHKCCAALNLFEMTNYLRGLELFPMLKETSTLQSSPHELSTMLFNAQQMIPSATTLSIGRRGTVPVQSPRHGQCHIGFRLANTMTRILVNVPWPVEIPTLLSIKRNGGEYRVGHACGNSDPGLAVSDNHGAVAMKQTNCCDRETWQTVATARRSK